MEKMKKKERRPAYECSETRVMLSEANLARSRNIPIRIDAATFEKTFSGGQLRTDD